MKKESYFTQGRSQYIRGLCIDFIHFAWVLEEGEKGLLSYDGLNETNDETANEKSAVDNVAAKELLLREVLMLDGEYGKHVGVFIFPAVVKGLYRDVIKLILFPILLKF